jgi:hypothetical protein
MQTLTGCDAKIRARAQQTVSSRGQWNVTCVDSIRRKNHVALPRYTTNSEHTIGAIDESSEKVQNASTHHQRCCHGCCSLQSLPLPQHGRHRPASRGSEVKVHRGNGGNVSEGSKCELPPLKTAHTQGPQSIQRGDGYQFKEGSTCKRPLHRSAHTHEALTFSSVGRWMKCHRRFKKPSTQIPMPRYRTRLS